MYNLPNILTLSRIAVIPFIFLSIYFTSYAWAMFAATLFVIASVTDYLDGYLARARNETSAFGRLLDPIADKLLVATALVVILAKPEMYALRLSIIPVFVILCREILVSGLREFLREVNVGLPVTKLAKWKTTFQMVALAMMMFRDLWIGWGYIGEFLLWVAAILTFITGYQYYQKSLDYVRAEEAKKIKEVVVVAEKNETAETKIVRRGRKSAEKTVSTAKKIKSTTAKSAKKAVRKTTKIKTKA
ncbi:MAG: CDP-diacylglycerol--glycerol-3-phosphate 3-phosphatidyltransferase [Alphaproteobacteria bacterium]|nr:CDP-diacylglycerol--glycerol-3-phosphate 3-phosphatidyltransferase [Alphaproteobacteria bacterium]MBR3662449.1 CDP-diacylglycerol--glycerol-3-phosphate 3-phosphatidyltransferase [Alphaproteobacteria bacterium]